MHAVGYILNYIMLRTNFARPNAKLRRKRYWLKD